MSRPCPLAPILAALLLVVSLVPGLAAAEDGSCTALLNQASVVIAEAEKAFEKANTAQAVRRADDALQIVDRAFSLCPGNRDVCALGVLGAVYANKWDAGNQWLERYTALTPYGERDPQLHWLRALVEARLVRRPDLAIRSLERMQALAPFLFPAQRDTLYFESLLARGNQLKLAQQYDEALKHFQTAAMVGRRSGNLRRVRIARVNMAITYLQDGRHAEAAELWAGLRKEEPDNPIWSYQHGLVLANMTHFPEAIEAYRHSIAKQPGFTAAAPDELVEIRRARLRLGNCLKITSDAITDPVKKEQVLSEGQRELEQFVAENPKDPLGHLWLGILLYDLRRDFYGAIAAFKASFDLDPMCETALRYLLLAYKLAGGPRGAVPGAPTEAEVKAWNDALAAHEKDFDENHAKRKKVLDARVAQTGDVQGGCQ